MVGNQREVAAYPPQIGSAEGTGHQEASMTIPSNQSDLIHNWP